MAKVCDSRGQTALSASMSAVLYRISMQIWTFVFFFFYSIPALLAGGDWLRGSLWMGKKKTFSGSIRISTVAGWRPLLFVCVPFLVAFRRFPFFYIFIFESLKLSRRPIMHP